MVQYNNAYRGSTRTPSIQIGKKAVREVYKGSTLVYRLGFNAFTVNAGASLQKWQVPLGITKIHVVCVASKGYNGGYGGKVVCDLNVSGGQTLYLTVGSTPPNHTGHYYNASDIRIGGTGYEHRVIVAGGGGNVGVSASLQGAGGAGGGLTGAKGEDTTRCTGGSGGTQTSGGSSVVTAGSFGLGGKPYNGGNNMYGGAGGSGWYGGGSGSTNHQSGHGYYAAGGGGGSSYTKSSLCSNVVHTQGANNGNGYITISMV